MSRYNYQLSLWQDFEVRQNNETYYDEEKIREIGSSESDFAGQAYNIHFVKNVNGMKTLTFEIPSKYYDFSLMKMVNNDLVDLLINKAKLKLFYKDEWNTFVINERKEEHTDNMLKFSFSCNDITINELSKNGYGLIFNEDLTTPTLNGRGTVHDLAERILASTDWQYVRPNETYPSLGSSHCPELKKEFIYDETTETFIESKVNVPTYEEQFFPDLGTWAYKVDYQYAEDETMTPDLFLVTASDSCNAGAVKEMITNNKDFLSNVGWSMTQSGTTMSSQEAADYFSVEKKTNITEQRFLKINPFQSTTTQNKFFTCAANTTIEGGRIYLARVVLADSNGVTLAKDTPALLGLSIYNTIPGTVSSVLVNNREVKVSPVINIFSINNQRYYWFKSPETIVDPYIEFSANVDSSILFQEFSLFKYLPSGDVEPQFTTPFLSSEEEVLIMSPYDTSYATIGQIYSTPIYFSNPEEGVYNYRSEIHLLNHDGTEVERIPSQDKFRTLVAEKSNRYQLLQDLSELFQMYIHFEVGYEASGRIKRLETDITKPQKYVYFKDSSGSKKWRGFQYSINLKGVTRTFSSEEIVTKLQVENQKVETIKGSTISIAQAQDNPLKENFIYNFRYYIDKKIIPYNKIFADLYDTESEYSLASLLGTMNTELFSLNSSFIDLDVLNANSKNTLYTYNTVKISISNKIVNKQEEISKLLAQQNTSSSTILQRKQTELQDLQDQLSSIEGKILDEQAIYSENLAKAATIESNIAILQDSKEIALSNFEKKYSQYILEGIWSSAGYTVNDTYYRDAMDIAATSAIPKVEYSLEAINLAKLSDEYQDYDVEVGDVTFLTDEEIFGKDTTGRPIQFEVFVEETDDLVDNESESIITIKNYKTSFEELFSRMSASVTSLDLKEQIYDRANNFSADGEIQKKVLEDTLINNPITLLKSYNNSIVIDDTGIYYTSLLNPLRKMVLNSDGIFLSNQTHTVDGVVQPSWRSAITADGINADLITTGQLDTGKLRIITNGSEQYSWDALGITSYGLVTTNEDGVDVRNNNIIRFDQFGFYFTDKGQNFNYVEGKPWYENIGGIGKLWETACIEKVRQEAILSITREGLKIQKSFESINGTSSIEIGDYINGTDHDFGILFKVNGTVKFRLSVYNGVAELIT